MTINEMFVQAILNHSDVDSRGYTVCIHNGERWYDKATYATLEIAQDVAFEYREMGYVAEVIDAETGEIIE